MNSRFTTQGAGMRRGSPEDFQVQRPVPQHGVPISLTGTAIIIALIGSGCTGRVPAESPPSTISTIVAATFDAAATATQVAPRPTATIAPTASPTPYVTLSPSEAERIRVPSDATMTEVQGSVAAGSQRLYVFRAELGQPLLIGLTSPDDNLALSLRTAGGTSILKPETNLRSWRGSIPQGEDYLAGITNWGPAQDFTLSIKIPNRLKFAEDKDFLKISAQTVGGDPMVYSVLGIKGQTMEIEVITGDDTTYLQVEGFVDGHVYLSSATHRQKFTMQVASTQDYIVEIVPASGDVVRFTLAVQEQ